MELTEEKKQEIQRVHEARLNELTKYIDSLIEQVESGAKERIRFAPLVLLALCASLAATFFGPTFIVIPATLLFWGTWFYDMFVLGPKMTTAMNELDGCFKTLEILGMIEPMNRKKRTLKTAFVSMYKDVVRRWTERKVEAQKETFGTAPLPA